ncbi:MAG: tetratricopeptide repeat protein [Alphaproteobacteria bacterium]
MQSCFLAFRRPLAFAFAALSAAALLSACGGAPRGAAPAAPAPPAQFSTFGSYLAARQAQAMRDSASAADFYVQALAADPANDELLRRAFAAMVAEGRIDEAAALAERLRALGANVQMAGLVRAVHAAKLGQYARAEAELAALPEGGYNSFIAPLLRGWLMAARGEPQRGVVALAAVGQMRGFEMFESFHAALMLDQAGELQAAGPYYERAAASGASYMRLVQATASYYARTGQLERAKATLADFDSEAGAAARGSRPELSSAPLPTAPLVRTPAEGMAEALFDLASLLNQQSLDDLAMAMTRLALHLQPDLDIALLLAADILESGDQEARAIEMYKRVPANSSLAWSAQLRSAALLDDVGRTDDAIATLEALAAERPTRPDALVALGDLLRGKERFAESVAAYDRAMARIGPTLEPRHWAVLYSRGIALERAKQWPRAEADLLKALELNPDQPYVLNYLGYSWVEHGIHLDKALAMIETAVKLRPEDGYIVDSMGWVLYKLGRFAEAVPHLERAAELRPADPTINDHLGDAYWRVGREAEARFQWERALALKPEPDQTRDIETKIKRGLAADQRSAAPESHADAEPAARGG